MPKGCVRHPDRPAATRCHRCQKPVCKSCLLMTPYGSFCSSECSLAQRALKEQEKAAGGKSPRKIWKNLSLIVMLVMMLLFTIHIFFYREGGLKGLLLRLFESAKEGGP